MTKTLTILFPIVNVHTHTKYNSYITDFDKIGTSRYSREFCTLFK